MHEMKMPQHLKINMVWSSNYCYKHPIKRQHKEVENPIRMMIMDGEEICPRCKTEADTKELQQSIQQSYEEMEQQKKYNTFYKRSIISDPTLKESSFDNFIGKEQEEITNKNECLGIAKRYKSGQIFNTFIQGLQGVGKSHLAYSILKDINESVEGIRCLFVSVEEMIRLIKDSFRNKESKYTEQYFIELLSGVDFLALDDLGAETGAIDTEKSATDFVQRVLYGVMTSRQDKVTIITTNLSSEQLFKMYDKKLVSRMLKKPKYVLFQNTKDKRITDIPF
jgi:DNA replication protein DnaC